jgi:hypothetical protein
MSNRSNLRDLLAEFFFRDVVAYTSEALLSIKDVLMREAAVASDFLNRCESQIGSSSIDRECLVPLGAVQFAQQRYELREAQQGLSRMFSICLFVLKEGKLTVSGRS